MVRMFVDMWKRFDKDNPPEKGLYAVEVIRDVVNQDTNHCQFATVYMRLCGFWDGYVWWCDTDHNCVHLNRLIKIENYHLKYKKWK